MPKLEAKSQGEKTKHLFENITPNTRETSAVRWSLKTQKKKSAFKTSSPSKRRLSKKIYLHIKPLGRISTQFVEQKRRKTKNYCHYSSFWKAFGVRHEHVERRIWLVKNCHVMGVQPPLATTWFIYLSTRDERLSRGLVSMAQLYSWFE